MLVGSNRPICGLLSLVVSSMQQDCNDDSKASVRVALLPAHHTIEYGEGSKRAHNKHNGLASWDGVSNLLTTAPGSRRPYELAVVAPLLELTGLVFLVVRAGLIYLRQYDR